MIFVLGCVSNEKPDSFLKKFEVGLTKGEIVSENLAEWLTQDALSDFKLDRRSNNKNYLKKIKIIYSNCVNEICSFTYDVSYKIIKNGNESHMDVRKQAVLNKVNDRWYIDEIDVIKSYIENLNSVDI